MDAEEAGNDTVVTQASFGGFDTSITAEELTEFLEEKIGLVFRCRLKTSWTPPESFPNFEIIDAAKSKITLDYKMVEPHAFVHFASPKSPALAMDAAQRCELFLYNQPLKVSLGLETPFRINQRRRKTTPFKLPDVLVEIGTLVSRDDFFVAWRGPPSGADFLVDPFDKTCKFTFSRDTAFSFKGVPQHAVIKCDFKLEFLVRDINEIRHYKDSSGPIILLQLGSSPSVSYRTADDDIHLTVPFDLLDDDDPWIRTTDLSPSGAIGRCNSYRVSILPRHEGKLRNALDYLKKQRVHLDRLRWPPQITNEPDFGMFMSDPFFSIFKEGIAFEIMFLVNAVMHRGIFNQYQLTESFFDLLRNQPKEINEAALKHICTYKRPVFDAYKRLKSVQEWILKSPKLEKTPKRMDDFVEIRRLIITPTRAYCLPPEVELSNRVLRNYKDVSDRFLRVTFMDEGMQTLNQHVLTYFVSPIVKEITSNSFRQRTGVHRRTMNILKNGFYMCGRKYYFLAFSANQLRDCSAWFFSEENRVGKQGMFADRRNISVSDIKKWMGRFTNRNVAKCAARMGQCFSSTYATVEVPPVEIFSDYPDIERNNFVFSDGIGMITPDLAAEVAAKLNLDHPPCAYQIRYAGCKGVVACWPPKQDGIRLILRHSMNKFISQHRTLEICSWTRFQPSFLNRQIIILLSTLGVPDKIFWEMQETMIFKLNRMLEETDLAFEILTKSCADQGNTGAIMLSAGFKPQTEPHLRAMLVSIRAAQLWGLREKARIFTTSGRWMIGCLDELGVLEQGQCFIQVSNPSLENCFLKHGSRFSERKRNLQVVKGYVVVAKNPCLHPGDIRILEAVDAPGLHHLYDCLVFPQKGDRPHTDEASGSDLDGDNYFATWDEKLIPPSKKSWTPMQYDASEEKLSSQPVSHQDIIKFFANNMVNTNLGSLCNAHVVHADRSEYGALDKNCLLLAELAATAVDFPKTGKVVTMPNHLKPMLYPDFMGKEDYQSYKSNKILGRLYRRVKDAYDDAASSEMNSGPADIPYDFDLEVPGSGDYILNAWDEKCSYDGQLKGLLAQYKVKREEELVTGHVWSMPNYTSRKQGDLKEKLQHSYNGLRKEFRQSFEKIDFDMEQLSDEEKNKVYELKASAWYQVTYHPKWVKKSLELRDEECEENKVLLSFPWIAADYLARIKIGRRKIENVDSSKPVNSLAVYLAGRM